VTKAYSYLRFSTPEQQQGDSFRRQTQLAVDYARQHGLELDTTTTFQDLGVSAYRSKNAQRGALRVFLEAVEEGEIEPGSYLLVESLDRISRDQILTARGLFLQIVQTGVVLVTLTDQRVYSTASINANPTDLIISLVAMMRANEESATKSRRLSAAWEAKRKNAAERPLTAIAPAWLVMNPAGRFEAVPDRALVVQRIFTEAVEGRGKQAIAEALNRDGVPVFGHRGRMGQRWHTSYVAKMLTNTAVMGTYTPHRLDHSAGVKRRVALEPVPDYYPPVVGADTYHQVQALRSGGRQPLRGRNAGGTVANVIGGLAKCPLCGGSMSLVTKDARWRYLVCATARAGAGCTYRSVRYRDVEQAIVGNHAAIVMGCPSGADEESRIVGRMDQIDFERDHLKETLATLLANAGRVRSPAIATEVVRLEHELRLLEAEETELAKHASLIMPTRLQTRLDALGTAARAKPLDRGDLNTALRALMTAVVVNFRSGYLVFQFQHGGEVEVLFGWPEEDYTP
jgi:DNA invertase Pin-like site-specific DNA recombinase